MLYVNHFFFRPQELIHVEFDVKALTEADFHGLKYLFQQLFWTVCAVVETCLSGQISLPEPWYHLHIIFALTPQ